MESFNGFRMIEHFTEFASPFLDIDFLDYSLKIPPKLRYQSKIYRKWMTIQSPEAVVYPWEATGKKITAIQILNTSPWFHEFIAKEDSRSIPRDSMNPFEYWFKTNKEPEGFFRKLLYSTYHAFKKSS